MTDTMEIKDIKFSDFEKQVKDSQGIVLLGAGGDLNDWINGVSEELEKQQVVDTSDPSKLWSQYYKLVTTGGRIDLALTFNSSYPLNIGKMAMWRLQFGHCSWISDYLVNYGNQH